MLHFYLKEKMKPQQLGGPPFLLQLRRLDQMDQHQRQRRIGGWLPGPWWQRKKEVGLSQHCDQPLSGTLASEWELFTTNVSYHKMHMPQRLAVEMAPKRNFTSGFIYPLHLFEQPLISLQSCVCSSFCYSWEYLTDLHPKKNTNKPHWDVGRK